MILKKYLNKKKREEMKTLEEEAEKLYKKSLEDDFDLTFHDGVKFCIEHIQAEKIKAQIKLLKVMISNCVLRDTATEIRNYLYKLEQQLKELEDGN